MTNYHLTRQLQTDKKNLGTIHLNVVEPLNYMKVVVAVELEVVERKSNFHNNDDRNFLIGSRENH